MNTSASMERSHRACRIFYYMHQCHRTPPPSPDRWPAAFGTPSPPAVGLCSPSERSIIIRRAHHKPPAMISLEQVKLRVGIGSGLALREWGFAILAASVHTSASPQIWAREAKVHVPIHISTGRASPGNGSQAQGWQIGRLYGRFLP